MLVCVGFIPASYCRPMRTNENIRDLWPVMEAISAGDEVKMWDMFWRGGQANGNPRMQLPHGLLLKTRSIAISRQTLHRYSAVRHSSPWRGRWKRPTTPKL